jgi:hypothetical protein
MAKGFREVSGSHGSPAWRPSPRPIVPPSKAGPVGQILALQKAAGNRAVSQMLQRQHACGADEGTRSAEPMVQRQIKITGSANVLHGLEINSILERPTSHKLAQLISLCSGNNGTNLVFDTYTGSREISGMTEIAVIGTSGRTYDLDFPDSVDWSEVDKDSTIVIKIIMNAARISGKAADVQTLLHELTVHAVAYAPFILRMRSAHKSAIRGIWEGASLPGASSDVSAQHRRLGVGSNRTLSAEIDAMGKRLEAQGLASHYLDVEHVNDMIHHYEP